MPPLPGSPDPSAARAAAAVAARGAGHRRPARAIKAPKAASAQACLQFEQLPNVGPAMARDLRGLGLRHPSELTGADAYALYRQLEAHSGQRQDPCVLDTFLAIVDFMNGAEPRPWWAYTASRKQRYGDLHPGP